MIFGFCIVFDGFFGLNLLLLCVVIRFCVLTLVLFCVCVGLPRVLSTVLVVVCSLVLFVSLFGWWFLGL